MGGSGGMVAIVQGLQNAGLAVTVMDERHLVKRRSSGTAIRQLGQLTHARSSVETSTRLLETSAQVCDGRYTSSYQWHPLAFIPEYSNANTIAWLLYNLQRDGTLLDDFSQLPVAHCRFNPSSPLTNLSEFPPQRAGPSLIEGNFEIGGSSSFGVHPLPIKLPSFRSAGVSPERSTILPSQVSRGTEGFAQTLRKYPSFGITPNRSNSTDLVQRLLAYTQAKNFSKSSYHTKTVRSNQSKPESNRTQITRVTKGVQTYTRNRARHKDGERTSCSGESLEDLRRSRSYRKVSSGSRERRCTRYKESCVKDSYDYLGGRFSRSAEVRYLSDMSRCLRQTLRQLCDECDQPTVCPNMQNRYTRHRREHHHTCAGQPQNINTNNMASQASLPIDSSQDIPPCAPCEPAVGTYLPTCPSRPKLSCFCRNPAPCICGLSSLNAQGKARAEFEKNLEEQVYSWLQEIPVNVNDDPDNITRREDMARELIEKLKGLEDDDNFEENAKNEITEFMKDLPMWSPGNKQDQNLLKNTLVDNLIDKIHDINKEDGKFEEEIKSWVDKVPFKLIDSQGKPIDKSNIIEDLIFKLKPLAINAPTDENEYNEILKSAIIDEFDEFPLKADTSKMINKLADDLANKLLSIPINSYVTKDAMKKVFQKQIEDWLTEISQFLTGSTQNIIETKKEVRELAEELENLESQGIDNIEIQERMQDAIEDWLGNNLKKNKIRLPANTKSNLVEKLRNKIIDSSKAANNLTEQVLDWAQDIPELSRGNKQDNQRILENIIEKAHKLQSENKSDEEVENELLNWMGPYLTRKRKTIDPNELEKLVHNIINSKKFEGSNEGDQINQYVSDWLKNVPNLDVNAGESKDMIKTLANKMQDFKSHGYDEAYEEKIKSDITSWLNSNTDGNLSDRDKENLANKLLKDIKSMPKQQRKQWNKKDIEKQISGGISEIFKDSSLGLSEVMDSKKGTNLQNKIKSIVAKNINQSEPNKEKIKKQIADMLEKDANMPSIKAKQVADKIFNKAEYISQPNHMKTIPRRESEVKESLKKDVHHILDNSEILSDRREDIESDLSKVLADQVMRGENDEQTKDRLMSILLKSNMSKEESENVANSLVGKGKEMSLSLKSKGSSPSGQSSFKTYLNPEEMQFLENSALEEILEFTGDATGDSSVWSKKKWKPAALQLAQKIGNIMRDPTKTPEENRQRLENEVKQYFKELDLNTPFDMETRNLADKLQKLVPQTSTPRTSKEQMYFYPQKGGVPISPISNKTFPFNAQQAPRKEEEKYMSQLQNKIDSWVQTLPIDLNSKEGKQFKDVMISDLAGDIIDRQKYLQLNPNIKTSDEEELEHLKYQVFRWLSKLPDAKQVMPSIYKTDNLMNLIKGVPVPQLAKPLDSRSARSPYIEQNSNKIQDEISSWLESIPSHLFTSSNQDYNKLMIKELAQNVAKLQANSSLTEESFQNLLQEWMQEMLNSSRSSIYKISEGLRSALMDKGLIKLSPERKSSKATEGELQSSIMDWIKDKDLYQKRMSGEKREIEQTVSDLSHNLRNALKVAGSLPSDQKEELLKKKIKSQLKKMPIDSYLKNDEEFLNATAVELLETMKKKPFFRDAMRHMSDSHSPIYPSSPKALVGDWINSLPLNPRRTSKEYRQFENMKQEFTQVLEDLSQNTSIKDTPKVREEIEKYLNLFPIDPASKADPMFMRRKVSELLQQLQNSQSINKGVPNPYTDLMKNNLKLIQNEISDWFGGISRNLYSSTDKGYHQKMINELAGNLHKHQESNSLSDTIFDNLLSEWLQKMLNQGNESFNIFSEGLKTTLRYKRLIQLVGNSDHTQQRRSIKAEELESQVLDWLKEKELYQRRTSKDKREQEQIVTALSKNLKDIMKNATPIKSDDRDNYLRQEIKKQIKKLPMAPHQKYDDHFHDTITNELLEHLNGFNVFQDTSDQPLQTIINSIPAVLDGWMESIPLEPRKTSMDRRQLDNLKQGFQKTLERLVQRPPTFPEKDDTEVKKEIENYLKALPIEPLKKQNRSFVQEKVGQLHQKVKEMQASLKPRIPSVSTDTLKDTLKNKINELPFLAGKTANDVEKELNQFASNLKDRFKNQNINDAQTKNLLDKEIDTFINRLPLDKRQLEDSDVKAIKDKVYNLFEEAKMQAVSPNVNLETNLSSKPGTKKAADILYENVENWCESLPIPEGDTPENIEKVKTFKQNLASKLINKIGDLNMQPEIFNDDSVYNELLNDELDNLLSSLPASQELEARLPALKENLIGKVKEAKQKTQDELAGYVYKQQLRNAISKTLPSALNLSEEEQIPFEILKDELADAYINLHHAADNDKKKNDLKQKITGRINSFCNNYLKRFPGTPLDPKTLNQELHKVLQKVHDPKDETIKDQVEEIRIKDEINEWLKDLPLTETGSPSEQLQKNKIVSVLAKRLHEIEKEKESTPDLDVKDKMEKEIHKWINKLPLKPGEDANVDKMVKQLTEKLKSTEDSRKLDISNIQHSPVADEQKKKIRICPSSILGICGRYQTPCMSCMPPCSLSAEEKNHLEKIRERARQAPCQYSIPTCRCKDASVSPKPQDSESQTEIGQSCWDVCGSSNMIQPQMSMSSGGQVLPQNQGFSPEIPPHPLSPQVIIRENYWNSTEESKLRDSGYTGLDEQTQSFLNQSQYMTPQQQNIYSGQRYQDDLIPKAPSYAAQQQVPIVSPRLSAKPLSTGNPCYPPCTVPSSSRMTRAPCMTNQSPCIRSQQTCRPSPTPCMRPPPPCMPSPSPCRPSPSCLPPPPSCMPSPPPSIPSPQRCMPSPPPCIPPPTPCMPPPLPRMTRPPCIPPPSSCMPPHLPYMPPPTPCMQPRSSCMPPCSTPQSPYMSPRPPLICSPPQAPPRRSPTTSRRHNTRPCSPCYRSPIMSDTSSPNETDIGTSGSFRIAEPRVTRLGSLDDVQPRMRTCGSQSPRPKRSWGSPDEDFEWTTRFPEDTDFWGCVSPRRTVLKMPQNVRPYVKERERKEEKVRCRCKERVLTTCMSKRSCRSPVDSIRRCSKCCGSYCPHPSYLYFG